MEDSLPQLNHFVVLPEEDEIETVPDAAKLSTKQVMKLKCVECLPDEVDAGIDVDTGIHVSEFFFYESGSSAGSTSGSTSGSAIESSGQDSGLSDPEGFTPPLLRNRRSLGIDDDSGSDVSADSLAGIGSGPRTESPEWMPTDPVDGEPKSLPHQLLEEIRMQALKLAEKKISGERIIKESHVKFAVDSPTKHRAFHPPQKGSISPWKLIDWLTKRLINLSSEKWWPLFGTSKQTCLFSKSHYSLIQLVVSFRYTNLVCFMASLRKKLLMFIVDFCIFNHIHHT